MATTPPGLAEGRIPMVSVRRVALGYGVLATTITATVLARRDVTS
jgi:hypothetical protein